jgi:hypothetical protein
VSVVPQTMFLSVTRLFYMQTSGEWGSGPSQSHLLGKKLNFVCTSLNPRWLVSQPSIPNPNPLSVAKLLVLIHISIETIPICRVVASHLWNLGWKSWEWYTQTIGTEYIHTEVSLCRENRKVVFTKYILSKCPKERYSPPWSRLFKGGLALTLG